MAGFLYQRLHSGDLNTVGRFAASVATSKLEHFGSFRGNEVEVGAMTAGMNLEREHQNTGREKEGDGSVSTISPC
jgi:hypothetical protein